MAKAVEVTRSSELDASTGGTITDPQSPCQSSNLRKLTFLAPGATEGMVRKGAIVGKSDNISASVMLAQPHSSSAVHHHGPQDTIVYASRGHGTVVFNHGKDKHDLSPGDFAIIPAYAEHQEVNNGDEEVEWIITRSGSKPEVVNLEGWEKS